MFRRFLSCLLVSLAVPFVLAACGPNVEDTHPGQPVKHRQDAFKQLLRAFEPYGVMLRTHQYDAAKMARLHDPLAASLDAPWGYFGPDTDYPPSKAKPELWQRPEEFARDKERFLSAARALIAAQTEAEAQAAYVTARDACSSCHKAFRR
jgi:cytochrome c556